MYLGHQSHHRATWAHHGNRKQYARTDQRLGVRSLVTPVANHMAQPTATRPSGNAINHQKWAGVYQATCGFRGPDQQRSVDKRRRPEAHHAPTDRRIEDSAKGPRMAWPRRGGTMCMHRWLHRLWHPYTLKPSHKGRCKVRRVTVTRGAPTKLLFGKRRHREQKVGSVADDQQCTRRHDGHRIDYRRLEEP